LTEIHKKRLSESKKKLYRENPQLRKKLSEIGKKRFIDNPELRERIRISKTGLPNPHKGEPWSLARREAQEFVKHKINKKQIKKGNLIYVSNWHELRKEIYTRDNWTCRECGKKCHNGVVIQCHHIDYDTSNNNFENLVTLCKGCHLKTNYKREDWIKYFNNLLNFRVVSKTQ
jgi:phage pi2 protein 07